MSSSIVDVEIAVPLCHTVVVLAFMAFLCTVVVAAGCCCCLYFGIVLVYFALCCFVVVVFWVGFHGQPLQIKYPSSTRTSHLLIVNG